MSAEWEPALLGDVADISIGRTPPRKEPRFWTPSLERPFCTIADMDGPRIDPAREGVTAEAEEEGKANRVPAGALMMSFKLTIGRVGFAARDLFPNEAIAWISPRDPDFDTRFLAYALEAHDYSALTGEAAKGATLNKESLQRIELMMPSPSDQVRIADLLSSMSDVEQATRAYLDGLVTARRSTTRALLSGTHQLPEELLAASGEVAS